MSKFFTCQSNLKLNCSIRIILPQFRTTSGQLHRSASEIMLFPPLLSIPPGCSLIASAAVGRVCTAHLSLSLLQLHFLQRLEKNVQKEQEMLLQKYLVIQLSSLQHNWLCYKETANEHSIHPLATDLENDLVISTSYQKYALPSSRLKLHPTTKVQRRSAKLRLWFSLSHSRVACKTVLHPLIKIRWKAKSFINYRWSCLFAYILF